MVMGGGEQTILEVQGRQRDKQRVVNLILLTSVFTSYYSDSLIASERTAATRPGTPRPSRNAQNEYQAR